GARFATVFGSAKLTLPMLQSKLQEWSREQQQLYDEALRLRPPASLQAAHQQVLATLQLRAIGLTALANTLATSGSKSADVEKVRLANQARTLSASDLVWANLFRLPATETMRRQGIRGVVAPASRIISNPEAISPRVLGTVYSRLKAGTTSGP